MEHYDLRVIENCLVFSYEVEAPVKPKQEVEVPKKCSSRHDRKKAKEWEMTRQLLFRVFLVLLMPFALLADAVTMILRVSFRAVRTLLHERARVGAALGSFSCLAAIGAMIHYL